MTISRKARRELCWIVLFLCCVPMLYFLLAGDSGYLQLREQRLRLREVRADNETLWNQNAMIRSKVKQLESDPAAIERIAREQNGLARPGDVIIVLPDDPSRQETTPSVSISSALIGESTAADSDLGSR